MPTVDHIRPIKKKAEADLLKRPGVQAVDIGPKIVGGKKTGELAIRVYVAEKKDVPPKQRIPEEIDGVSTDVIQLKFKLNAFVPVVDIAPRVDATRYGTIKGGMSVGPCRSVFLEPPDVPVAGNYNVVGTLGALVIDNESGDRWALTNFHVAAVTDGWSVGDSMAQPGLPDGGACPADGIGDLRRAVIAGTTGAGGPGVDGAVIRLASRPTDCSILEIGDVEGTAVATDGMAVRKRGRTTELTFGSVESTTLTVTVPYGDGIGGVTLEDQILIEVNEAQSATFGISGDSGSAVVNEDNRIVGLYFAGNEEERDDDGNVVVAEGVIGVANPIAAVEAALNVTICAAKRIEKKLEPDKIIFKDLIKDFKEKERFKDFKEKDVIKDWKEPKEIFEDKPFDKQLEGGGGFPAAGAAGTGDIEARLAQIQAAVGLRGDKPPVGKVKSEKCEKPEKLENEKAKSEKVEKPEKRESGELKNPKEKEKEKDKDFKEPKELKEHKEHKEFKERGPKEFKERQKEIKEPKEIFEDKLHDSSGGASPSAGASTLEERLSQIEAALGQQQHFIGPSLRPDLATGALKQEPDLAGAQGKSQELQQQAQQAKAMKDNKDNLTET